MSASLRKYVMVYKRGDPYITEKLLKSLYVDDSNTEANSVQEGIAFILKPKMHCHKCRLTCVNFRLTRQI